MMTYRDIPEMEQALRERGLTIQSFCARASVHVATWGRWRRAETAPNTRTWDRVMEAFEAVIEEEAA